MEWIKIAHDGLQQRTFVSAVNCEEFDKLNEYHLLETDFAQGTSVNLRQKRGFTERYKQKLNPSKPQLV